MTAADTASAVNEPAPRESQQQTNKSVAKASGLLALGNIASRVLGLLREIVLTNLFGASAAVDAFKVAILIPKSIYDLLIAGHVNGAIIPVLSEVVARDGRGALWRLVSILISMVTAVLAVLVLVVLVGAPVLVEIFGEGFDAYTKALAVDLLRVTAPALIFMGLFSVLSGTLYALQVFSWPAFATAVFNGAIVFVALVFVAPPQITPQAAPGLQLTWVVARPDRAVMVMAIGWLVGSVAYLLLQMPGLRGSRLGFTLDWRHPALRRIGLLYIPVMLSLIMDTVIVRPFSYNFASQTGEGSISYMDYATTLIQFPQGLVATAISIAILPMLSRQAALIQSSIGEERGKHNQSFKDTLGLGLRLVIALILPATVALFILARPVIMLLFEGGAFTAADTTVTVDVLRLYLIGLPFAAVDLLLVYAFYARQDTLTPALVGVFSLGVYIGVALLMMPSLGLLSLMVADSVKHMLHAGLSMFLLSRRIQGFSGQGLWQILLKSSLAVSVMGLVGWFALPLVEQGISAEGTLFELLRLIILAGISGTVFLVLAIVLRIQEFQWLIGLLRDRLLRKASH